MDITELLAFSAKEGASVDLPIAVYTAIPILLRTVLCGAPVRTKTFIASLDLRGDWT